MTITIVTTKGFLSLIQESFEEEQPKDIQVEIKTIEDYHFRPHSNAEQKLAIIVDESPNHIYFLHVSDIYGREANPGIINHKCDEDKNIRVYTFSHQQTDQIFKILTQGDVNALIDYR